MVLFRLRLAGQFLIRVLLGVALLPLIFSAGCLLSLAALCTDKGLFPLRWVRLDNAEGEPLAGWLMPALQACFSRKRREKHAPQTCIG